MASEDHVDLSMYDRNTVIARASEQQHRVNLERELHYLGLDMRRTDSGLAYFALQDVFDFVEPLENAKKPGENQLPIDFN